MVTTIAMELVLIMLDDIEKVLAVIASFQETIGCVKADLSDLRDVSDEPHTKEFLTSTLKFLDDGINMKSVFIVEHGEQHEGGDVVGVYTTREKAVKVALEQETCFGGGWKGDKDEDNYWTNGCDYVKVTEHNVEQ